MKYFSLTINYSLCFTVFFSVYFVCETIIHNRLFDDTRSFVGGGGLSKVWGEKNWNGEKKYKGKKKRQCKRDKNHTQINNNNNIVGQELLYKELFVCGSLFFSFTRLPHVFKFTHILHALNISIFWFLILGSNLKEIKRSLRVTNLWVADRINNGFIAANNASG